MKQRILYTAMMLFATLQTFAQTNTYEYDANNRLTKVTYGNGVTVAYSYDALGNRTSKKVTVSATKYTVTTSVSPANAGTVTGGGSYYKDSSIELKAVANSGYKFSKWSDGNTDNPRTITVTGNKTYTAQFVEADDIEPVDEDDNVIECEHKVMERVDVAAYYPLRHFLYDTGFKCLVSRKSLHDDRTYRLIIRLKNIEDDGESCDIDTEKTIQTKKPM